MNFRKTNKKADERKKVLTSIEFFCFVFSSISVQFDSICFVDLENASIMSNYRN